MQVDRVEVFKKSAKIEGSYNESKFKSLLDENYNNFCNFCNTLNEKYDSIDSVECILNEDEKQINFSVSSNNNTEKYSYNY